MRQTLGIELQKEYDVCLKHRQSRENQPEGEKKVIFSFKTMFLFCFFKHMFFGV